MTYNIFAGNDLDRQSNLSRIATLIDTLRVDLVLLQEVDRLTARSGGVDQLAVMAAHAGMNAVYGAAMPYDGGEFGVAVLSRWPVRSSRVVKLEPELPAEFSAREPRALLHVVVDVAGTEVHILNTHLDQGARAFARHPQLLEILAYVAEHVPRGAAVVFGGDLNARPDTPEVRALGAVFGDAWAACGAGDGATFRSDGPDRRIDYIMLAGAQCTAARVPDTLLSDHRPVLVDLTLNRPGM